MHSGFQSTWSFHFQGETGSEMKEEEVKETDWGEFPKLKNQIVPPCPLKMWTEICFLTIYVIAGPSYTWKHCDDQPYKDKNFCKWLDCIKCKIFFNEFCILFWINRLNCPLCLNMFKTGNVYIKPKLRKSSQRYYPKNVKITYGKGFKG